MSCIKYKAILKKSLSGEISPGDMEALDAHAVKCRECHSLLKIHSALGQTDFTTPLPEKDEFSQMRARVMNKILNEKQQKSEIDFSALWQNIRTHAWRPAVAFSLILGFLLGRIMPTDEGNLGERIIEGISMLASESKNLFAEDKSGYRYSNVTIKELNQNEVQMSFDVSTHVDVVREKEDPFYKEILAQTLLSPGNAGTRLKAISSMENIPDPKFKQALIHTIQNDPSDAIRMKAVNQLQHFPKDEDVISTMLHLLKEDESIKIQRDAFAYLKRTEIHPDTLKNILENLDKQRNRPIDLRMKKFIKTKKERK
jgi:hypothetical protein